MKLKNALFQKNDILIYQVNYPDDDDLDDNFLNWNIRPIKGSILTPALAKDKILDGLFLLKGLIISAPGEYQDCYLDLVMPERISEKVYFQHENNIIQSRKSYLLNKDIVPLAAIDKFGVYELYYSRIEPQVGINVLEKALNQAKRKQFIAEDLGYIFRDEKRFLEAIDAFSLSIAEGPSSYFIYVERARLYEMVGEKSRAETDWKQLEELIGKEAVEITRWGKKKTLIDKIVRLVK